ncbi:MAG: 3-keto-5-aminohexanoate cleavage protein [Hyphomicrobiales bacterium]|nr:3-keto-5-aminohexanoate cleavage protein [Hyphomicrobiales bacterium]MCP5370252.1 3-keto-5-aminohexanoate cleavage protein [Hyphomicrobiales bacterium]
MRVELQDSLCISRETPSDSNVLPLVDFRDIARRLETDIATPDETREIIDLKGGCGVMF